MATTARPRRILVCQVVQEVSTFNPVPSEANDFDVRVGEDFLAAQRGHETEVGGALDVLEDAPGVTVVPGFGAWAFSSAGILTADGFRTLENGLLAAVRADRRARRRLPLPPWLDGRRRRGGPGGPAARAARGRSSARTSRSSSRSTSTASSRDRMLEQADAVVSYLTYPHVDFRETGRRAARLLLRILDEGVRPVTARVDDPGAGPRRRADHRDRPPRPVHPARRRASRRAPAGCPPGSSSATRSPTSRSSSRASFVTTDGDAELAARRGARPGGGLLGGPRADAAAARLARARRSRSPPRPPTGTVILTDAADATSSGASGDSNAILRALADGGYRGTVLAPIVDAPAVEAAFAAGLGGTVRTTIGGRLDPARFAPMPFEGRVTVARATAASRASRTACEWFAGPTAVLDERDA